MKKYSSKLKLLFAGLILFIPLFSSAADLKKDEIKKQLDETVGTCAYLVEKIQSLADRVAEREAIMLSDGSLSKKLGDDVGEKLSGADKILSSARDETEKDLPALADAVLNSDKPVKEVSDFRKGVNNVRAELLLAHKLILEAISLIKG